MVVALTLMPLSLVNRLKTCLLLATRSKSVLFTYW